MGKKITLQWEEPTEPGYYVTTKRWDQKKPIIVQVDEVTITDKDGGNEEKDLWVFEYGKKCESDWRDFVGWHGPLEINELFDFLGVRV